MKTKKKLLILLFFIGLSTLGFNQNNPEWVVPDEAKEILNPLEVSKEVIKGGKKNYDLLCAICHGPKGKGDGIAGMALKPKPSNFQVESFQNQTDGAIYWKITNGRPPMAPYQHSLTDEQRWELVNYLRTLKSK